MAATRLTCPVCGGSRSCRAGEHAVVWVCPDHPAADPLDMHDMAGLLTESGRVTYGDAIRLLRVEILGLSLNPKEGA